MRMKRWLRSAKTFSVLALALALAPVCSPVLPVQAQQSPATTPNLVIPLGQVITFQVPDGIATFVLGDSGIARVVVPPGHALLKDTPLTLEKLARYPLITYDFAFTCGSLVSSVFAKAGLTPNVVLTAIDADVIKTYVQLGLGVCLLANMAYDPERDTNLS